MIGKLRKGADVAKNQLFFNPACACIGHVRPTFSSVGDLGPLAQFNTKSVTHVFYVKNVIFIISLMCRTRERCVFAYRVAPRRSSAFI